MHRIQTTGIGCGADIGFIEGDCRVDRRSYSGEPTINETHCICYGAACIIASFSGVVWTDNYTAENIQDDFCTVYCHGSAVGGGIDGGSRSVWVDDRWSG
jgi:hypothetical protein